MVIWLTPFPHNCPRGLWMSPDNDSVSNHVFMTSSSRFIGVDGLPLGNYWRWLSASSLSINTWLRPTFLMATTCTFLMAAYHEKWITAKMMKPHKGGAVPEQNRIDFLRGPICPDDTPWNRRTCDHVVVCTIGCTYHGIGKRNPN